MITGKSAIGNGRDQNGNNNAPSFSATLLPKVQSLPYAAEAQCGLSDTAQLLGRNGKVISNGFAPGLAFSVNANGDQRFNPLNLVAGTWPHGDGEIAIDANTADKKHYAVGDTIGAIARGPVRQYKVAGIVKLAGVSSIGGATFAIFDLPTAQKPSTRSAGSTRSTALQSKASRRISSSRRSSRFCRLRRRCAAGKHKRQRRPTRIAPGPGSCRSSCSPSAASRSSSASL